MFGLLVARHAAQPPAPEPQEEQGRVPGRTRQEQTRRVKLGRSRISLPVISICLCFSSHLSNYRACVYVWIYSVLNILEVVYEAVFSVLKLI